MSRRLLLAGLAGAAAGCGLLGGGEHGKSPGREPERGDEPGPEGALERVEVTVAGAPRRGALTIPRSYDGRKPVPVLIAVHGSKNEPRQMYQDVGWGRSLDELGWIGIYPETGHNGKPSVGGEGDTAMFDALLAQVTSKYAVDPGRIAITGFSGGCRASYIFAIANKDKLRAVAGVGGSIMVAEDPPGLTDPVAAGVSRLSMLHIHGARDPKVKVGGGPHRSITGTVHHHLPVEEAVARWTAACGAIREVDGWRHPRCPSRAAVHRWESPSGLVVQSIVDPDMEHEWPQWATPVVRDWLVERMA